MPLTQPVAKLTAPTVASDQRCEEIVEVKVAVALCNKGIKRLDKTGGEMLPQQYWPRCVDIGMLVAF